VNKDTLTFAVLLSVVDFFLSLLMISGIGAILALLPLVNRFGKLDDKDLRRSD
jgi:hypothetical protein